VIIFDEYQKKETINLKTRVTPNVLSDRNPRKILRKNFITVTPTPNHNKIDLKKDRAINEKPKTFFYVKVFKR
jgi:hypothetical protein